MPKKSKVFKNAQKAHNHFINSQNIQNNDETNYNRHFIYNKMKKIKNYIKNNCLPFDYEWTIAHLASNNQILKSQFEEKYKVELNKKFKHYCKNKNTIRKCLAMRLRNNLSKQNWSDQKLQ
jgi:hypothetical protein